MKKTIMLADHSHAYLKHIALILRRMGFAVMPVERAIDVVQAIKAKKPDLIVMDEDISSAHVLDILDWLKKTKATADVQVVMMSSHPNKRMSNECRAHGCAEYIKKPISLHKLHKILEDNIYAPLGYHRKHLRALYYNKVGIVYKGKVHECMTESLSEGGLFVSVTHPLPVGTEVEVLMDLEHGNNLRVKGRVIYVNEFQVKKDDTPKGMAIEFAEPDKNALYVISDYVKGLLTIPVYKPL